MNRKSVIGILLSFVMLTSCASTGTKRTYVDPNYKAYVKQMEAQIAKEQKPLIDLTLTDDGRVQSVKMYPEQKPLKVEQYVKQYHPVWGVIKTAVPVVGTVFGIRESGKALERIINSSSGDVTYTDSYNDNSDGSVATTTTTTNTDSYNTDSNNSDSSSQDTTYTDSYNTDSYDTETYADSYNTDSYDTETTTSTTSTDSYNDQSDNSNNSDNSDNSDNSVTDTVP